MRSFYLSITTILILALVSSCAGSRHLISSGELKEHIKYLSSDALKGRLTGTAGDSLAAEYIRSELREYGLRPLGDNGFQRFKVTDKVFAGSLNNLLINGKKYNHGTDFEPASFSENGSLNSTVIFGGYGFTINSDSLKWDDYKGQEFKGKWIMILRGDPEPDNSRSRYASFSGDRDKAMVAKDLGAGGVLLVSGSNFDKEDKFDPLSKNDYSVGIPVIRIKRKVADEILQGTNSSIESLETRLNTSKAPASFAVPANIEAKAELVASKTNTRNVIMILPGTDSLLKKEYVIVGAHFDHLGMGGPGSGSRAVDTIGIHHGADDNASGVSMVIELAGKFAATRNSHKRSIVFCAFTGEELGLLGSKYFTDNPPVPLNRTDAMVNLDMVGRLKDNKELSVGGVGTAAGLKEMVSAGADTNLLKVVTSDEGSGPSDHSSFYSRNIPVLFITTGAHADYHTPSDTWDKINFRGMVTVSDFVYRLIFNLSNDTARLRFREAGPRESSSRNYRRKGVTLGIMPDVTGASKNGLRVDAVTPGRPAALGGMKKNDIIVAINGKPVNNIQDYMFRMGQLKHGERITVDVIRNGRKEVLIIEL